MTGISFGWFEGGFPPDLGRQIRTMFRQQPFNGDLFRRRELRAEKADVGVAYGAFSGPMGLRGLDPHPLPSECFYFVLEARNRPCLMVAARSERMTPIMQGIAPPTVPQHFALGSAELKPGMAIHLDESAQWLGITSMPAIEGVPAGSPSAAMVIVRGFARDNIAGAIEQAMTWIALDMGASAR